MKYCAVSDSGNTSGSLRLNFRQHVAQFFVSKNKRMNNSIVLNRKAQRALDIKRWMGAKSETGSALMGESVTRREVVTFHLIVVAVILTAITANSSVTLAALFAVASAWATYQLNKFSQNVTDVTEKGGKV